MSNPLNTLLKTCSSCGLRKPLSAFLEFAGLRGTSYGMICSDCRRAQTEQEQAGGEKEEEASSHYSGVQVNAKARFQYEKVLQENQKETEVSDLIEQREKDLKTSTQTQRKDAKNKAERSHRESFLDKNRFLPTEKKSPERSFFNQQVDQDRHVAMDSSGSPILDTQIKEKLNSPIFRAWKDWVGNASPLARGAKRADQQDKKAGIEVNSNDTPEAYIDKHTGPKRKR